MAHRRKRAAAAIAAAVAAALIPVATAGTASAQTADTQTADTQTADPPQCRTTVGEHHAYTLLGAQFFTLTQRVDWCTQGGQVVWVGPRIHTFDDPSSFAQFRGLVEDYTTPIPAPEVVAVKKATVENCIPGSLGGCMSVRYPYVKIVLRGDGTSYVLDGG